MPPPLRKAGRLGAGLVIATIASGGSGGDRLCGSVPSTATAPAVSVVWTLDTLTSIGGHVPAVLGAPQVTEGDHAVHFNGVDDGLTVPVNPLAGLKEFTIEILFEPRAGGGAEQRFFHVEDDAGSRVLLEIRMTPDGQWALDTFMLSGKSGLALLDRSKLHPADRWCWVALRYDGRRMTHYVNGRQELEGHVDFAPMQAGRASLGVRLNRISWFKGALEEVRIHGTALAAAALQRVQ